MGRQNWHEAAMAELVPVLDAAGVNALLRKAFPDARPDAFPTVLEVAPGRVKVMAAYREGLLRPGGVRQRHRGDLRPDPDVAV
jgi:hypothetical protein